MEKEQILKTDLPLNIFRITMFLSVIAIFLIICSVIGQLIKFNFDIDGFFLSGLIDNFFLGSESNVPTYYISFLNLSSAVLLFIITAVEKKNRKPYFLQWTILSLGFLYISMDEVVEIHEELSNLVAGIINLNNQGFYTFSWVIPGIIIVLLLALFFARFITNLDSGTRVNFLIAAILYVGGAIGLEMLGGRYYGIHGSDNLTYRMMQNVEESLEMAGLIVFIWALMRYMSGRYKQIIFEFTQNSRK